MWKAGFVEGMKWFRGEKNWNLCNFGSFRSIAFYCVEIYASTMFVSFKIILLVADAFFFCLDLYGLFLWKYFAHLK